MQSEAKQVEARQNKAEQNEQNEIKANEMKKKKKTKTTTKKKQKYGTAENDAVQALLARYLQKRLQGTQLSTLPPPAVLFNSRHQAKVRQAAQKGSTNSAGLTRDSHPSSNYKDNRKHREDYEDDYVDDLQGFEDSDRSRTRIDLLAGVPSIVMKRTNESCQGFNRVQGALISNSYSICNGPTNPIKR
ncbi:low affinity immunoglobulin epsilon Fc receptor-like isoform X2 [Vespula squamosa]|uniref:Low affinity immunoglobulin epsilon Fc receptor-like isoform X2 n=1 Tax=Vespula squamosa TaxID=30214 RepID=A0ABD2B0T6_VESSQ